MFDLSGRTALVTGAGRNIGAGIAKGLASHGAHVVVNDYFADRAQATADEIIAAGGSAVPSVFDVTDLDAVTAAVAEVGVIAILVNNAGLAGPTDMKAEQFRDMDPADWQASVDVNLYGVMNCCHAVVDAMCERGWGRVITVSSAAGTHGVNIGVAPYSAGKGGGLAFTRSLALEVARSGVTANTLALGLFERKNREISEHFARAVPVGRTGRPEDVATACIWLASDEAEWVTAQTIGINGGSLTS